MNHLKRFTSQLSNLIFLGVFLPGILALGGYLIAYELLGLSSLVSLGVSTTLYVIAAIIAYSVLLRATTLPIEKVWQAIWHVSPGKNNVAAPKLDQLKLGRELVSSMVRQVYDLASSSHIVNNTDDAASAAPLQTDKLIDQLPVAILLLDKQHVVTQANTAAAGFFDLPREKVTGKHIYDTLRMSFTSDDTFDTWLQTVSQSRATDTRSWEHVRTALGDGKITKQFDLAASYSKDDSSGHEVTLAIFDRTADYDQADQSTSYVSLAVHELRTPLTVLRGYIEVFEDELGDQLSPEHKEFMRKMSAAAQTLTAFVSNILNVARIDENQLTLSLHEANWNEVLPSIIKDLELRASVRSKTLELNIQENLPTVAIDRISIYEVVSNLVDNAIKYSGQAHKIIIHSQVAKDGTVSTEIEDFGPGIPENVVKGLFTKFYRSHRSNSVGGSGLGLYLVKSIITAHGGNVWVNSHEGKGSKFGFSLQTFASIKSGGNGPDGIERQASGWIKNHSMYRR